MPLSDETRRIVMELSHDVPWGEEANIDTAEKLAEYGVDEDSIIESIRAVTDDYKERYGAEADQ